jgi:hypothetical protein
VGELIADAIKVLAHRQNKMFEPKYSIVLLVKHDFGCENSRTILGGNVFGSSPLLGDASPKVCLLGLTIRVAWTGSSYGSEHLTHVSRQSAR